MVSKSQLNRIVRLCDILLTTENERERRTLIIQLGSVINTLRTAPANTWSSEVRSVLNKPADEQNKIIVSARDMFSNMLKR